MAKSNNAFIKKQKEEIRKKKKLQKEARKEERKRNSTGGNLEDMMAYVDEFGNITSTPPEKRIAPASPSQNQEKS
jgi:S-adenosylmethionine hydrolase